LLNELSYCVIKNYITPERYSGLVYLLMESEADHSPLSSAEVKNALSYTSTLSTYLHGMVLI